MSETPNVRVRLEELAAVARRKGNMRIEAICLCAVARLDEYEAELVLARARRAKGGRVSASKLTPAQRRILGGRLARARWDKNDGKDNKEVEHGKEVR